MKTFFFTILALVFSQFFLASSVFAQTEPSCGNIITPANYYYEGYEASSDPISDCSNPFGRTGNLTAFKLNNQIVSNYSTIEVSESGANRYGFDGETFHNSSEANYYLHSGNDYIRVNTTFVEPVNAQFEAEITNFFNGNPIQVNYYTEIYLSSDPIPYFLISTNPRVYRFDQVEPTKRVVDIFTQMTQYIVKNAKSDRPALVPGTYTVTLVDTDEGPNPTFENNLYQKVFAAIIPTALAYYNVNTITFTLVGPAPKPIGASSVLFLPGIQASRLYTNGLLGTENQLWETNGNIDVKKLSMTESGQSINSIYTRDIPGSVYLGYASIYGGFIQYMDRLVADNVIKDWRSFAYDWRYSVDDIANNGTQYQNQIKSAVNDIEQLASSSNTGKVTIIGHSNGGLLAKAVMNRLSSLGKTNLIDTVVFLASPQLGTPKAVASILHGYDQELGGGLIVDDKVARDITKNMPGAYGLVPSAQYFATTPSIFIRFENSTSTKLFRDVYGGGIDSLTELSGFMTGLLDGRSEATTLDEALRANAPLLQKELLLHENLDNWVAPSGVKVVEIIGTGLDTISGFEYRSYTERVCNFLGFLSCSQKLLYKPVPLITQFGDQTVVGQSALGYRGDKEQYFVDLLKVKQSGSLIEHYNITEAVQIQQLLRNIITSTSSDIGFISTEPSSNSTNRLLFGTHSPVSLELKDMQGRRAGRGMVNNIAVAVQDIPGSSYFEIGSSTYVIVPDDAQYNVLIKGTSQGGLVFSVDTLKGSTQTPVVSVQVATITPSTTINASYNTSALGNLLIDQNNDGLADQILTSQGIDVTPKVTYPTLRNAIQKLSISNIRKTPLLLIVATAETLDKNPKLSGIELITLNQLEAVLGTYQKNNWITPADLLQLKGIISKLK